MTKLGLGQTLGMIVEAETEFCMIFLGKVAGCLESLVPSVTVTTEFDLVSRNVLCINTCVPCGLSRTHLWAWGRLLGTWCALFLVRLRT